MDIEDLSGILTDGNHQTGIPLLDTSGHVDPVWLKFETWKNEADFDVSLLGQSLNLFLNLITFTKLAIWWGKNFHIFLTAQDQSR